MAPMRGQNHFNAYDEPFAANCPGYFKQIDTMSCVSHCLLVFLRKEIGLRLLHPLVCCRLYLGLLAFGYVEFRYFHAATPEGTVLLREDGVAMMGFALAMAFLMGVHRYKARRAGGTIHTRSRGRSVLTPLFGRVRIPEWFLQVYIEPMTLVALGVYLIFGLHALFLGAWITFAAACLFGVEVHLLKLANHIVWDLRDNRIESHQIGSLDGGPVKAQATAAGPGAARQHTTGTPVATLSPELQRLKGAKTDNKTFFRK